MNISKHVPQDHAVEVLARIAHRNRLDAAGHPYILYVARVAGSEYITTSAQYQAAWLHSALAAGVVSEDAVRTSTGVSDEVLDAVRVLIRRQGQSQADHIAEVRRNEIAYAVAKAENRVSADPATLALVTNDDERARLTDEYVREWAQLIKNP